MKTIILTVAALTGASVSAQARGGGGNRPETIQCGLYFAGEASAQAPSSALVENATALLRGAAQGVDYVFSVRGKTAVARLVSADSGLTSTAQGAIEMLRHGGENRALEALAGDLTARRGGDDDQDGNPEREAGFELSLAQAGGPVASNVKLKCSSTNTHEVGQ